jgi:hypothetical protein
MTLNRQWDECMKKTGAYGQLYIKLRILKVFFHQLFLSKNKNVKVNKPV